MSGEVSFRIPSPPSVNNLFANVPGRGRVRSSKYRIWANAAAWAMKLDGDKPRTWDTFHNAVTVEIVNGNRRQDLDNCIKPILDLMVDMGVMADDKQVVSIGVTRGLSQREALVTVREFQPA